MCLPLSVPSEGRVLPSPPSVCLQSKHAPSHRKLAPAPARRGQCLPGTSFTPRISQGNGQACHAQAGQGQSQVLGLETAMLASAAALLSAHCPCFVHSQDKDGLIFRSSGGCLHSPPEVLLIVLLPRPPPLCTGVWQEGEGRSWGDRGV